MSEYSKECQEANWIAARLRGTTYKRVKSKVVVIKREREPIVRRNGLALVTPERVYEFVVEFFRDNDQLPTSAHIGIGLQVAHQTAHEHLMTLVRLGFLEKNSVGKYRFTREQEASHV